jgi:glycosyltransferase involved in cell wall biosynthesis
VLARKMAAVPAPLDCMVMWGSWFSPRTGDAGAHPLPFVNYIDQSRSLDRLPGESPARLVRRGKSHALQSDCYRDSTAVLCMSRWAERQTLEAHPKLSTAKVRAIGWGPCGVDLSGESIADEQREPIVLHVSNDFHRKGVDYLIETAKLVGAEIPAVKFIVIGRDSGSGQYSPGPHVSFLGPIYDRQQLASWFRRASVFFLPHRFDRSPHVLVEAMSAGLPLVASHQGGAVELLDGTGVGFSCEPGNVRGYADAILRLLREPKTRQECGRRARQLQAGHYTWRGVAQRMLDEISARLSPARGAERAHAGRAE